MAKVGVGEGDGGVGNEDAVADLGIEEDRAALVRSENDVVEHKAEIDIEVGQGLVGIRGYGEIRRELATAERGLLETLALLDAAVEHGDVLGGVILRRRREHERVGLDDVSDVAKGKGIALGDFGCAGAGDEGSERSGVLHPLAHVQGREFGLDLVAAKRDEADGVEDRDAGDDPAHFGTPTYGVEDVAGGGWSWSLVRGTLHFGFRASPAGESPADLDFDGWGHSNSSWIELFLIQLSCEF